ncbi:asparagine synthase (glutamine-hydrolyzing) [Thermosulfuriphilus ammonigenes]|uniref:asparagine synthase (glutamine-hydrolyzing) n=1 Tax=Thermosulfuriphilus ammonigenes TaxID=1936021 RepID=A0A6G7PXI2_9BACT|nr:asparagine synthase (glutamine-hydrolyzing) [Thermosulfuriphilus ammonigenes]MBA2849321.1 asparagine synthase (glutamine-hydrolyzing) [Thermosulfuriphilus ammonigenes]QIJ72399.1 asparagine synthase (glutamine-hydrolyzing) [Thermosulfuriphilus ammonigenes]
MCGIAGVLSWKGPARPKMLHKMKNRLTHRGPDSQGIYLQGPVGLVHTRLSIIDVSGGSQPIISSSGRQALVANGEIYNFKEVRERLELKGRAFISHSDSEVILQAYLEYGLDFLRHLAGMFAFAIWDGERNSLILARDRLGIKPLYYLVGRDFFLFASEKKALLPFLAGEPEIRPEALFETLQYQFLTGEKTLVQGINRLPPAEMLIVYLHRRLERRRYWSPATLRPRRLGFEEARDQFDLLFEEVFVQHLRCEVPLGVFLSGGLDSAVILACLRTLKAGPVRAFTVVYPQDPGVDEFARARWVARHLGASLIPVRLHPEDIWPHLPRLVWALDEFMWDPACVPTFFLAHTAQKHHLKVVYTGEGGDEVFAGYGRYRKGFFLRFLRSVARVSYRGRGHWPPLWQEKVFGHPLKAAVCQPPFRWLWAKSPRSWGFVTRAQYVDIQTELADDLLVKVDRMLMGHGLEGRVPFLDHRVVEFGLCLPSYLKVGPHQGKVFLRRWAEALLPRDYLWSKKKGFHVPLDRWLKGPIISGLQKTLPHNRALRNWFDPGGLRELLTFQEGRGGLGGLIWSLIVFALWHRIFIEEKGEPPGSREDFLDFMA